MKKLTVLLSSIFFLSAPLLSQEIEKDVVSSSGNHYKGNGVSLSWTLGEVMIESYKTSKGSVFQGFHQAGKNIRIKRRRINPARYWKSYSSTATDSITVDSTTAKVYPNPASEYINIDLSSGWGEGTTIEIVDVFGRKILIQNMNDLLTIQLDISALKNGLYILQIKNKNSSTIKSFKILKIK